MQKHCWKRIVLVIFLFFVFHFSSFSHIFSNPAPSNPHQNSLIQPISRMDAGWVDFYREGQVDIDYLNRQHGNGSLRITPCSQGFFTGAYLNLQPQDMSNKGFRITFKVSSWERLESFFIAFSSRGIVEDGFEDFFFIDLKYYLSSIRPYEWETITLSPSNLLAYGNADWRNINTVIVRSISSQHPAPTLWVDDISMFDNQSRAGVVIAFDDGHLSSYTMGKITMEQYGFAGINYIIPPWLGEPGFVNEDHVFDMVKSGWDIGGHSDYNLVYLSPKDLAHDIKITHEYLEKHQFPGRQFYALPYGQYNEAVIQALKPYFPFIRPNYALHQPSGYVVPERMNSQVILSYTPVAQIIDWIDRAMENQDLLILVFHKVEIETQYETEYSLENFIAVLDYLKFNQIPVVTLSEFFGTP